MDIDLYRYIPFESFVNIVQSNCLTFMNPIETWEDTYEGYLFRGLKSKEGSVKISEIISRMQENTQRDYGIVPNFLAHRQNSIWCLCWSREDDTVPMWTLYSHHNRSVKIKTTQSNIIQMLEGYVELFPLEYVYELDLETELKKVIYGGAHGEILLDSIRPYLVKRAAFKHENEVRAFYKGPVQSDGDNVKTVALPIKNQIHDFITEVQVHPLAPDWYVKTVEMFCDRNHIRFIGKSQLYQFSL